MYSNDKSSIWKKKLPTFHCIGCTALYRMARVCDARMLIDTARRPVLCVLCCSMDQVGWLLFLMCVCVVWALDGGWRLEAGSL